MKKIQSILFSILCIGGLFWSCSDDDYEELNRDPNNPIEVEAEHLFVASTISLYDQMEETNVNLNIFRMFAQYWTATTYTDEANYDLTNRRIPTNHWDELYLDVLNDLKDAKSKTVDDPFKTAQAEVLEVYTWQILVDTFGDIPYFDALKVSDEDQVLLPAYDNASDIYEALITRIDLAISNLSGSSGSGYEDSDLIYNNSRSSWLKFAYSLKLKLGIRLSDVNPSLAQSTVEEAFNGGLLESNQDNATIEFEGTTPNTNPIWEALVESGRNDFVPANTIVDYMNGLEDPRRDIFFNPNSKIEGEYVGGTYGEQSAFTQHSHIGAVMHDPTFRGVLLDFTEIQFHLAEAAALGWNVGGTEEEYYNAGIEASFLDWGLDSTAVTDYLNRSDVAYNTAAGDWKEKIAKQFWIAMYNRGFEGWYVYRKFDAPQLNIAANSQLPVPKRYTYPLSEQSLNASNWNNATNGGTDDIQQFKIFWDVN